MTDKLNLRVDEESNTVELIYGANPPLKLSREAWDGFLSEIQNDQFKQEPTSLRDEVGVPKESEGDKPKRRKNHSE